MATPGVKNFLLNCTADEVGHKPALIVTVSATRGGSYPVAELRMSGYKNNRLTWLPEHVIVQHVEQNLNAPDGTADLAKEDAIIRKSPAWGASEWSRRPQDIQERDVRRGGRDPSSLRSAELRCGSLRTELARRAVAPQERRLAPPSGSGRRNNRS